MRLLRGLALATAIGAWAVIVIGGYVTATNTGLACQSVIDCGEARAGAENEISHRLAAWVEGFLVLALLVVVLKGYRTWIPVRNLTLLSFALVTLQAVIGMVSVYSGFEALAWYPVLVTAHLGVATLFLAVSVWNAATILRGTPPIPATASAPLPENAAKVG
ncbi:MAG TPA: COX15/CtaA family protein [Thermoplasmata archaeon]|nr:COX15/CtaA family protein [Thermoplasmata archaeon]